MMKRDWGIPISFATLGVVIGIPLILGLIFLSMTFFAHLPSVYPMKRFDVELSTLFQIRRGVYEKDYGMLLQRVLVKSKTSPAYGDDGNLDCCQHDAIFTSYPTHYDIPYGQNQSIFHNVEQQWNQASGKGLFCGSSCRHETYPQGIVYNYKNQISFGEINIDIEYPEMILGLTAIWYRCLNPSVPISSCTVGYYIQEWDMVINTADNEIGDASMSQTVIDLLSLLLHEFGHVCGLGDIYSPGSCVSSTMWGWLLEGDYSKRLLDNMTKVCVESLYNNTNPTSPWISSANCFQSFINILHD